MNRAILMALLIAPLFTAGIAVGGIQNANAGVLADYFTIEAVVIENSGNNGVNQSVHIDLAGNVPSLPASPADFGWAVPTTKGFLIITSHPDIGLDSTAQPPDEVMHTHFLTAAASSDCTPSLAATFATKNEVGRLSIVGDEIWVKNVPRGLAGDLIVAGSFSFTLDSRDGGDEGLDESLCIDVESELGAG